MQLKLSLISFQSVINPPNRFVHSVITFGITLMTADLYIYLWNGLFNIDILKMQFTKQNRFVSKFNYFSLIFAFYNEIQTVNVMFKVQS